MGKNVLEPVEIEFDCLTTYGVACIKWYHYPEEFDYYFLRLAKYEQDTGWREVCVKVKVSELEKIRDAINKTIRGDIITTELTKVEFDTPGISYLSWYFGPYGDGNNYYFLRLHDWQEDNGWREVCVKITKSELKKIRDAIDKTLNIGV